MPRRFRLKSLELAGVAAATGIGWGVVMALVALLRQGSEVVLLQAFILVPAWFFGWAVGELRGGALAGLALVGAAVFTYELLPMWGLEARLRRENPTVGPSRLDAETLRIDRSDIALLSTLAIGALVGFAGGLHGSRPAADAPTAAAAEPPPPAPQPPPAPLWAGYGSPQPPQLQPAPPAPPPAPPRPRRPLPWGAALLMAAFATDWFFERLFGIYSETQRDVALGFLIAGVLATTWFARRWALLMIVAGAILAAGAASLQDAEYDSRRDSALIR